MKRFGTPRSVLLVLAMGLVIALPYITTEYYTTLAILILGTAMLAQSVNLLAGDAGLLSMGHAAIAAAAGYGLAWSSSQGFPLWVQLLIALALTLVASATFGVVSMRTKGVFFVMVTLAVGMVFWGMSYRWSDVTGGENGITGIRRPEPFGQYWTYYFLVLAIFVVVTVALLIVSRSPFGTVLRGMRDSESRMRSIGYNIPAYKFTAMMMSGTVAGLAGVILVWQQQFISPSFGDFANSSVLAVILVLGGLATVSGPLVGTIIVVLIQQVLSTYFDRWMTLLGVLFIVAVIFAPKGLVVAARELVDLPSRRPRARTPAPKTGAMSL